MRTVLAERVPATADTPVVRSGRVLYLQYTNPGGYPPLVHSARILADAGFEVLLLGTARRDDARTFPRHERVRAEVIPFEPAGWRQKWHYVRFTARAVRRARQWRPDWIYLSDPLSCPIAIVMRLLGARQMVYHEHDSPSGASPTSLFMRVVLAARRHLVRRVELCVLPSAARAANFQEQTGREQVVTVWNCPSRLEVFGGREPGARDRLRVLYHGSIVPARFPGAALEALATLPPAVVLVLVGYETVGSSGYVADLQARAADLGVGDRFQFLGPVSRDRLMQLCADCDVGLAFVPSVTSDVNLRSMVGASNKAFDYLACGLALLVSDLPDWRRTYVEPGYALACDPDSAESIAAALRWLLEHPDERRAMGERGRRKIADEWNYERTFAPVLRHMLAAESAGAG